MQSAPVVKIFWTGGWDSTFRLLHLLLVDHKSVQPYYIIDPFRRSTMIEIATMAKLRTMIRNRLEDPRRLYPSQIRVRTDYPIPEEIEAAFTSVHEQIRVGDQYRWMAAFCLHEGLEGIELCHELSTVEPIPPLQAEVQKMVADDYASLNPHIYMLFRYYSIVLTELSKADLAKLARVHGFHDILSHTWSCHQPVLGKPCGACRPCWMMRERDEPARYSRLRLLARVYRWGRRQLVGRSPRGH